MGQILYWVGNATYGALALTACWGAYQVLMVWLRVAAKRFKNEDEQNDFLIALEEPVSKADFDGANTMLEEDGRAVPQLAHLALMNRKLGYSEVRKLVYERFQRDVMADLEHRLAWINTVIKSAPMVGLFGTVVGMMGAFEQLATAENVDPAEMANNIMVALITTASGLAIAIPMILLLNTVNIRIRKMEDLAAEGLGRFLAALKVGLTRQK